MCMSIILTRCWALVRILPPVGRRYITRRISEPSSFGPSFQIPTKDSQFPLEVANEHPRDKLMHFDEQSHRYTYDGTRLTQSVTEVVSNYFEKFVPEAAVEAMRNGSNWPRPQYMDENGVPHTAEQIIRGWEQLGEVARNQGTWMHWNIEKQLNGLPVTTTIPEFKQFLQFEVEVLREEGIRPYRTEWRVAAPELGVGGSIDFVGQRDDGSFVLVDWKRSKNLSTSMYKSYGKYGRPPLDHLPDCDGSKYSLQLNIYRYILARYYDIEVSRMVLGCFHPSMRSYFKAEVPVMDKEVAQIVSDLSAKRAASSKDS